MTVGELLTAVPGLQAIGAVEIPSVIASYAIAKAKKKATGELETIEAARVALCERHAQRNAEGVITRVDGQYQFVDPAAFQAQWQALLAESITLPGVRAVTVTELAGATVSPDVLFSLGPFVVEAPESA